MKIAKSIPSRALAFVLCLILVVSSTIGTFSAEESSVETDVSSYGTQENGITKTEATNLISQDISVDAETFSAASDFSEGLKYWGPSEKLTGSASNFASVSEDGVLTVHYNNAVDEEGNSLAANYDGIQTVRINIPDEIKGKQIGFICEVTRTTKLSLRIFNSSGTKAAYTYNYKETDSRDWYKVSSAIVQTTEEDSYVYLQFIMMSAPDSAYVTEFSVRNLHFGYKNDDGIFTDFQGELWNTDYQYNTPYYGTAEDGIYSTDKDGVYGQNLVGTDVFNGDFSNGLKYWSSYNVRGISYASDIAKVVEGQLVLTAAADSISYHNIMSAGVNIPKEAVGKKLGIAFYMDSPTKAKVKVTPTTDSNTGISGKTFAGRTARTVYYSEYVITETDTKLYLRFQQNNESAETYGVETKLDDIIIFTYDDSTATGYTFDGEPVNSGISTNGYYLYGSEEKGIYKTSSADAVEMLPATDTFKNGDFSKGLKYWGLKSGSNSGYPSSQVRVVDGKLMLDNSLDQYSGVRSVSFNIPTEAYNKNIVINCDISANAKVNFKLYSDISYSNGWKTISSSTNGNTVNVTTTISDGLQLTDGDKTLAIEIQLLGNVEGNAYAYIDNLKICYIDEGGLNLPAELNGAPVNFEYGDANADKSVDVKDLVRVKKFKVALDNTSEVPLYLAAANADAGSSVVVDASDLIALRKILLKK